MVGEHGGAAFVLLYVAATLLVSLPVFIAEVIIGRRSRCSSYGALRKDRPDSKVWKFAAILTVVIPFIINSYYIVIGGWSLDFLFKSCTGEFVTSSPDAVGGLFGNFISSTWMPIVTLLLFLATCAIVIALGVKSGIEKFSKISIPVLFFLIVAMAVYSISLPGAMDGVRYLAKPDFSQLSARSFAYALGQSFYSLSLGMGAIITYGSYVKHDENIVVSSIGTAISDLLFAILAGFAIMPAVFAAGIEPGAGPGLIFQSIPFIFSSLGTELPVLSTTMAIFFFLAVTVAAMTSCMSLFEVCVSFVMERFKWSRTRACIILFLFWAAMGIICSLSFGPLAGITVAGKNIFDLFDWFSSNIMLLTLAFLTVIFTGFVLKKEDIRRELTNGGRLHIPDSLFNVFYFLTKWAAPVFIAVIFITNFIL